MYKSRSPVWRVRGWIVNGTRLFGSFQRKIFSSNKIFEKVALFFWTECSKRKFVFHFFKGIFDLSSQISGLGDRFSENRTDSYKRLKRSTRFRDEIYQSRIFITICPIREPTSLLV